MYAIVELSGNQFRIEKDMKINVNKMDKKSGDEIVLDKILMVVDGEKVLIGEPYLKNAKASAKVLGDTRGKKVRGIKFKRRKNYTRTLGHRAEYTMLQISDLSLK